ncbi:non-ribosomal peptide synthetase [Paenibacillus sp. JCM 10914]|uniref:non-ribosomal peptide synthetase n=1 Tax=Paenibacillus sp. JCM 10914 TaxID=1236974 RepID=UPI0022B0E1B5|nr:non-ribosomal peptide synthetase [Paenibacillus sp. JCM 10914]
MLSYPVTPSQKRLFILQTIDPSSVAYNVPGTFMFEGKVDPAHIRNIFYKLISRHESLRTTFEIIDGVPVQRIHDQVEFEMEVTQATDDRVRELVLQFVQPFELERGPLFRAKMIELSGEKRLLFVDMHHIITDGLSMSILLQEFQTLYHNNHLPENQLQYKDYTAWFNERVLSDEMKQMESYWLGVLSGQLPILELPTDRPRQVRQSNEGKTIKLKVDKEMKARLTRLAFNTDSTAFMVLFAAYNIMLYKYTRQKDLIVGVPAAGRTHKQTESMIGVFINTLALRNRIDPEQSFESFLRQVRENSLDAYENQEYPFDLLVEKLELSRDISRNPVFDTMFSMQHEENVFQENNGMFIRPYEIEYPVSKFDLSLDVEDNEDGYVFAFEYNTDLWDEDTAIRFASHYVNLLSVLGDKGDIAIKDIGILSSQEHSQIVNDFNSNRLFFSGEDTFPKVFEHVACSCEDLIAVVDSTKSYTYREINAKANQLARKLRGTGLEPGMAVGILADRSADMIIAVIAVMKAGGAYLPVDPEYPAERIEFLLRDSQSGILVAQPQYEILAQQAFNGEMISLEESVYSGEDTNLPDIHQPSDLAYVIYTSGSTGLPKGVMIEHRSLINAAFVWRKEYNLQDFRIRLLQLSSFSFDVFAGDLCRALLNGGQLVLCENEARADLEALYDLMSAYRINVMESTPALIVPLMEYIHSNGKSIDFLKLLILGSDVLPVHDYSKLKARFGDKVRIINSYGVTEACIDASYYEGPAIMSLAHMPVGKPLPNAEFYVLDEDKQIQPIGVIGELYIGGEGVARGYYRNPVLTEERFIDNPFKPASRMYRTGDMAKWMPGGNLLLIGREDRQVNLHGHRIELGEVEAGLLGHPKVKEAAALIRTGTGESHLCAFIVSDNEVETDDVYRFLQQTLPFYMLPSRIVPINQLPLTPNMKIDYRKLELTIEASIDIFVAPRNELEEKLAEIWRNVLHLDRISTNDSLFAIGGNSLKAMTIVGEAAKRFDIHLNLRDMFQFPTIRQLAELVKENDVVSGSYQRILPAEELLRYPLTPAQRRLFLLEQMQDVGTSYNTPIVLKVSGELQIERLETAIHTLVQRHESLRTSFEWLDGELFQRIHEVVDFSMKISSFSETTVDLFASELIRPFELGKAPLIRFGVGQWNDLEHLLILDMHHIIADGISAEILLKEIVSLYEGTELPDVTLHYKDYAVWLKKQEESGHLTEQEQYWLKTFGGKLPVLQLTTDFPRPPVQCFDGDYLLAYTDAVLLSNVKQIAIEHETTMFVVLLSIFNLLLHKYTDQNDLIVGTPVAGRNHPDIGDTVGMFVNTLALRNFPSEEMTFSDFLGAVKETTLSAFAHQDYPLEDLIEKLDLSKDLSRNALFDVLFVLQDSDSERLMIGQELRFEPHLVERKVSKFDLTITVEEKSGGLEIHLEYSTALFTEATAKRITNHYIHLIRQVTESPLSQLKDFQLITPEEKKQVVFDFNRTESVPHKSSHICHLLKEAVELHAARPAIITDTHVISYDEFNRLSNSLARRIVELGIKANETVAVMGKRSIPMLIGIMAVLKSGGAYLPLDPDYPEERTRYILKDSKTNLLLTFSEDTPDYFDGHILYLDDESIYQNDGSDLGIAISSTDLAYVIYTSGSTGQPKGVMVEHGSLMNRLNWMQRRYPLSSLDVVLQKTTAAFDVSVWELFWWIFSGAQVCLLSPGEEKDPSAIVEAIDHHQITTLHFVPSMLQVFLDFINLTERSSSLSTLRTVFASGEALKRNQVVLFNDLIHSRNGAQLVNLYGPTEATIDVTSYNCSPLAHADIVPIGCPIDNTSLYVLNRHLHHQPIGVIGELAIAGMGLARGYLHNPSLTSQKFVNLPEMKERVYLTGDLVKWLPDGNLAYIGRSDHQVKIRGYRIELGEIETHLCQCHGVKNAAAVVRQDANGEDDLWAFVVCEAMKVSDLNEYLIERIPQYMVPSRFHFIDKMPLLSNGKADRNVLAQMEIKELHRDDYLGPRNRKEELLTEIWKEVLGSERVGVRDNFFTVGGQSLRAANVVSLLYKKHRIALSLRDLFLYPTIEQLSERLISIDISKDVDRIPKAEERELYPISSAQKRLLILNELNEESLNYNMPSFLKVTGNIDVRRVEEAFVKVIARHETLRTSIVWVDAEPYQKVHQEVPFSLKELTCLEEDLQNVAESLVRPFNLQVSPFFRASMVRITDGDYRVLFTDMHHIVSDGMSQNVFWNDFIFFYQEGGHLEEVPLQYKDFAVWQQDRRMSTSYLAQENYWLKNLATTCLYGKGRGTLLDRRFKASKALNIPSP